MSETDGLVHPVLEGCELRLAAARAAGTDRLATFTAMARIPDDACAACAVEKVEQCRRATHDVLIAMTAAARLSAVVWIEKAGQEGIDLLDALGGPDEGTSLGSYTPEAGQYADSAAMVEFLRVCPRSIRRDRHRDHRLPRCLGGDVVTDALFDVAALVIDPPEPEVLSADRRRTLRQAQAVASGVHPLGLVFSGVRMHPDADRAASADDPKDLPLRCGSCCFRQLASHHNRSHAKCTKGWPARASHSAATDVRAWWPACTDYVPVTT